MFKLIIITMLLKNGGDGAFSSTTQVDFPTMELCQAAAKQFPAEELLGGKDWTIGANYNRAYCLKLDNKPGV